MYNLYFGEWLLIIVTNTPYVLVYILQAELDLDKPHRDALFNLTPEKKWQIYCSKKQVSNHTMINDYDIVRSEMSSYLYTITD